MVKRLRLTRIYNDTPNAITPNSITPNAITPNAITPNATLLRMRRYPECDVTPNIYPEYLPWIFTPNIYSVKFSDNVYWILYQNVERQNVEGQNVEETKRRRDKMSKR